MIIRLQSAPRMTLVTLRIGKASASLAPVAVAQTVANPYALVPASAPIGVSNGLLLDLSIPGNFWLM